MALKRKPVQKSDNPEYPDSQDYSANRRDFLLKLGIGAAGLLGLAGCGAGAAGTTGNSSAKPVQPPVADPSVTPRPVTTDPIAQPVAPPPGLPPNRFVSPDGTVKTCPTPVNANPQAPAAGGVAPIAQPQAIARGEAAAPIAQPLTPSKGNVAVPAPAQPQAAPPGDAPVITVKGN